MDTPGWAPQQHNKRAWQHRQQQREQQRQQQRQERRQERTQRQEWEQEREQQRQQLRKQAQARAEGSQEEPGAAAASGDGAELEQAFEALWDPLSADTTHVDGDAAAPAPNDFATLLFTGAFSAVLQLPAE